MITDSRYTGVRQLPGASLTPRVPKGSLLSPLTKTPSARPPSLPWEEEKYSSCSPSQAKTLSHLHRENLTLKSELRDLNSRLDSIISDLRARKEARPYHPPKNTVNEELKLARAQLSLYEKEHAKYSARSAQLADPSYKIKLSVDVEEQEKRIKALEADIQRRVTVKLLRDKVLESVVETGETPEMVKDIKYAITEVNVFSAQVRLMETNIVQIAPHIEKLAERERELVGECRKLEDIWGEVPENNENDEMKASLEAAKKDLETKEKQYFLTVKKLKSRIKQLRGDLSEVKSQSQQMEQQISEKAETSRQVAEEIRSLTPLMSKEVRKLSNHRSRSISRGYGIATFLTQDCL